MRSGDREAKLNHYRGIIGKTVILGTILLLIIVVMIAYLIYSQTVFFAVVGSGSMEPTLMTGDLVLIRNIHADPQMGDIIMLKINTVFIIRRVVSVSGGGLRTKGDAMERVDNWIVSGDQIRGEVVAIGDKPVVIKSFGEYFHRKSGQ